LVPRSRVAFGTPQVPDWLNRKLPAPLPSVTTPVKLAVLAWKVRTLPALGAAERILFPLMAPLMALLPEQPMVLDARTVTGLFNVPPLTSVNVPPLNCYALVPRVAVVLPSVMFPCDSRIAPVMLFVLLTVSLPGPDLINCIAPFSEPVPLKV